MKSRWIGLTTVALIAGAIIGYKAHLTPDVQAASTSVPPRVLLLAEPSEANDAGDSCAEIIHLVRAARERGVAVRELEAGSKSNLLARYHMLVVPTVVILDGDGKEVARFEGEGRTTVKAIRAALAALR